MAKEKSDLLQGTLDMLILKALQLEPMHGWAIAQRIRSMSKDELRVGQSALYPALHKLEQQGWIEAEWRVSEKNRRAKYYKLTAAGRKALKVETAQWERLSAAISMIVKPASSITFEASMTCAGVVPCLSTPATASKAASAAACKSR